MPPRIAMQKFVEGSQNLRQTTWFVEGFAFDKPLSSKFVEKEFVEGSLKVIGSSLRPVLYETRFQKKARFSRLFEGPRLFGLRFVFPRSAEKGHFRPAAFQR